MSTLNSNDNQLRLWKLLISVSLLGASALLTGCSSLDEDSGSIGNVADIIPDALDRAPLIYRPTIQQGNEITQEQVNKLNPGMSRRQVRFILGSPTLQDVFHDDRWDYPFTQGVGSKPTEFSTFSVYFENDRLVRVSGDLHPQPKDQQKPVEKPPVVKVPDWDPEAKTLFGKALELVTPDDE